MFFSSLSTCVVDREKMEDQERLWIVKEIKFTLIIQGKITLQIMQGRFHINRTTRLLNK